MDLDWRGLDRAASGLCEFFVYAHVFVFLCAAKVVGVDMINDDNIWRAPLYVFVAFLLLTSLHHALPAERQERDRDLLAWLGAATILLCIVLPMILSSLKSRPRPEESYDQFAASALAAFGTIIIIAMIYAILFRTHLSRYTKKWITIQGSWEEFVAAFFFCSSIIVPLLYFRFLYDPKGTVKPAWTEQLG